jgi:hypothetical protein
MGFVVPPDVRKETSKQRTKDRDLEGIGGRRIYCGMMAYRHVDSGNYEALYTVDVAVHASKQ